MMHHRRIRSTFVRVLLAALITGGIFITPRPQLAEDCGVAVGCKPQPKIDLAFMLDRSGSMATRGQTWNIMVDGVIRALRDRRREMPCADEWACGANFIFDLNLPAIGFVVRMKSPRGRGLRRETVRVAALS